MRWPTTRQHSSFRGAIDAYASIALQAIPHASGRCVVGIHLNNFIFWTLQSARVEVTNQYGDWLLASSWL